MSSIPEGQLEVQGAATNEPTLPLWRNRDYLLLLGGQAVSLAGTQISEFAFPLLVLASTRSPAFTGIASGLVLVPYFFLCLPAGALVDRWDRQRIMLFCDSLRALALVSIPVAIVLGHLTLLQLLLVPLLEGTFRTFFDLSATAALSRVVPKEQVHVAANQQGVTQEAAYMLGPVVGASLLGLSRVLPFLVDALSYAASVGSLLFIRTPFQERRAVPVRSLWQEVREGFFWLWHRPALRFLALLSGVMNALDNSILILVIVLATRQHVPAFATGLVYTIAGTGAILTGLFIAGRVQLRLPVGRMLVITQSVYAALVPLYLLALHLSGLGAFALLAPLTLLLTMASFLEGSTLFGYRLTQIPEELQGRVNSVFRLVANAGPPLGMALTGVLLQVAGAELAIVLFSASIIILASATWLNAHVRAAGLLTAATTSAA